MLFHDLSADDFLKTEFDNSNSNPIPERSDSPDRLNVPENDPTEPSELDYMFSPDLYEKLACPICGTYITAKSMPKHVSRKHNVTETLRRECHICHRQVAYSTYADHVRRHAANNKKKQIICTNCGMDFMSFQLLIEHIEQTHTYINRHSGEKVYKCLHCSKEIDQYARFRAHLHRMHRDSNYRTINYHCRKCKVSFPTIRDLNRHEGTHCECDVCHKYFSTALQMQRHKITHGGANSFECFACHRAYDVYDRMQKHTRQCGVVKSDQNLSMGHLCSQCGVGFAAQAQLRKHLMRDDHQVASGESLTKPYECSMCDKRFKEKTLLKEHFRRHTGEHPFKCEVCDKAFISKARLSEFDVLHDSNGNFSNMDIFYYFFSR